MKRPGPIVWLALGAALAAVGQARFLVPLAIWVWPALLARFTRTAPARWALPGFVVAHTVALEFAYWGMVPLPTAARVGLFVSLSIVLGLVFLTDRWISRRYDGLGTTLALPCGWVAYDFAQAVASPNGTWGSVAYVLTEQGPVAQLASITGWVGLTFLVAWVAAAANWIWERLESGRPATRGIAAVLAASVAVVGHGFWRLSSVSESSTVKVALLAAPDTFQGEFLEEVWRYTRGVDQSAEGRDFALAQIADWQNTHFDALDDAIGDGAQIAVWAEVNAAMTAAEEESWIERARETSDETDTYVGLGLAVFRPRKGLPTQNRFVLTGPDGEIVWDYSKATRVPGDGNEVGDGVLPRADTPHGRLTGAICFDMDFPQLLRQAGAMEADVLIAPSNDWEEVRATHARMAVMRAIEQGVNLVRPTKDGISVVADACGRVVASLDTTPDRAGGVLVADAPARGTRTIYARIGDAFAWAACAGFLIALAAGLARSRPESDASAEPDA